MPGYSITCTDCIETYKVVEADAPTICNMCGGSNILVTGE